MLGLLLVKRTPAPQLETVSQTLPLRDESVSMKDRINLLASILGIIGFLGTIVSWAIDERVALVVSFVLLGASAIAVVGIAVQKRKSRVVIEKVLEEDLWVSSSRRNRLCVDSSFLSRDEGTLLFWILVPGRGEGLRDAPHNRYLFSHQTGEDGDSRHLNAFFLRYSSEETWDFWFSNPEGGMPNDLQRYRLEDRLTAGWHHVQISWNHSKPILSLLFDAGNSLSLTSKNYLPYWPREFDNYVYFGAWVSDYPESYVETKLRQLWICDGYLDATHSEVLRHRLIGRS